MLLRRAAAARCQTHLPVIGFSAYLRGSVEFFNARTMDRRPNAARALRHRRIGSAAGEAHKPDDSTAPPSLRNDASSNYAKTDISVPRNFVETEPGRSDRNGKGAKSCTPTSSLGKFGGSEQAAVGVAAAAPGVVTNVACLDGPGGDHSETLHTRSAQERRLEGLKANRIGTQGDVLRSSCDLTPPPPPRQYSSEDVDYGGNDLNANPTSEAYDDAWDSAVGIGTTFEKSGATRERGQEILKTPTPLDDGLGLKIKQKTADDSEVGQSPREDVGVGGDDGKSETSRVGEERAHKMWVTMTGGNAVSEHEWEAEVATAGGKEDTAVIQFHSEHELRFQGFGVIKEDKAEDIQTLVDSFTAPALAAALRDRETALHVCARLLEMGDSAGLRHALNPFTAQQVATSRRALRRLDLDPEGFTKVHMYTLKKVLQRLPRHVTTLTAQRASVMIPLCNVDGVASVLFTKRSASLRSHKNEVCFPGGKVDIGVDQHIIHTALREMGEEIGIDETSVDVLGVLRCDWGEVASLIGVAVTPVVGFLGNLSKEQINPNPDEVSHCFTIPIRYLLTQERWKTEKYKAPTFVGGPYVIWGLTGYILHRLVNDVLLKHLVIV